MRGTIQTSNQGLSPGQKRIRSVGGRSQIDVALLAVAAASVVLALVLSGQAPRPVPVGLPDAGSAIAWTVILSRALMRLSAVGVIGCLLTAGWLLPSGAGEEGAGHGDSRRLMRSCGLWAGGWILSTLVLMFAGSAQLLGISYRDWLSGRVWSYIPALAEGRSLMLSLPLVVLVALHARTVRTPWSRRWLLVPALLALLPLTLTGHAATASNHYLAAQSIVLHVLAATIWVGGLLGLVHLRHSPVVALAISVRRFSSVALVCFVVVALSGMVGASTRLGADPRAWQSTYGALVGAKIAVLTALGLAGWWHRGRTVPALLAGRRRAFARLAAGEVLLMGMAIGIAAALARTAAPPRPGYVASPHPGASVERGLARPDSWHLLGEWRPNALVVTLVGAVAAAYFAYLWRHTRLRDTAARSSAAWFGIGLLVLLWAFLGGPALYQNAMLSAHVLQLMLCVVVVPRLLARALGAVPGTDQLTWRSPRTARILALTSEPVNSAVLVALLLGTSYATPLLGLSLRSSTVHQLVSGAGLVVGAASVRWPFVVASAPIRARASGRAVAMVLALFGGAVLATRHIFAEDWFSGLGLEWGDPGSDQRYAGVVLLLVAAGLALLEMRAERPRQRVEAEPTASRASMACL